MDFKLFSLLAICIVATFPTFVISTLFSSNGQIYLDDTWLVEMLEGSTSYGQRNNKLYGCRIKRELNTDEKKIVKKARLMFEESMRKLNKKLHQTIAKMNQQLAQDLAEMNQNLSREIAKRTRQMSREMLNRPSDRKIDAINRKLDQDINKMNRKFDQNMNKRNRIFEKDMNKINLKFEQDMDKINEILKRDLNQKVDQGMASHPIIFNNLNNVHNVRAGKVVDNDGNIIGDYGTLNSGNTGTVDKHQNINQDVTKKIQDGSKINGDMDNINGGTASRPFTLNNTNNVKNVWAGKVVDDDGNIIGDYGTDYSGNTGIVDSNRDIDQMANINYENVEEEVYSKNGKKNSIKNKRGNRKKVNTNNVVGSVNGSE